MISKKPIRRKRFKTETSSFGTPGRICHDSSKFYSGRLYAGTSAVLKVCYVENTINRKNINKVFCGSSEKMAALPDDSVHLMVTSPPYNVGKQYDRDLSLEDYLGLLGRVFKETYRVLVPGGRACVNVANLGRKPYIPLNDHVTSIMQEAGFLMRGEIIWDKGSSAGSSTAWGTYMKAGNPVLRDVHEYILVFCKQSFTRLNPCGHKSTISGEEFLEFTRSVWKFPAEKANRIRHPAPFPIELPYRLIQLYTFDDEVVLDPFNGSGSTCLAAIKAHRRYVAYDIDGDYCRLAEKRIKGARPSKA